MKPWFKKPDTSTAVREETSKQVKELTENREHLQSAVGALIRSLERAKQVNA